MRKAKTEGSSSGALKVWTICECKGVDWYDHVIWPIFFKTYYELGHPIRTGPLQ